MSKGITILGCGYLGQALARRCLEKGWRVSALTRNTETARSLEEAGVSKVVEARLDGTDWHERLEREQDFVVNCVGAADRTLDGYRQSYVMGQDSVREWLADGKVGTLLFTGSISVYPQVE